MRQWFKSHPDLLRIVSLLLCMSIFIISIARLTAYSIDLVQSKITTTKLRSFYHAAPRKNPTPQPVTVINFTPLTESTAILQPTPDANAKSTAVSTSTPFQSPLLSSQEPIITPDATKAPWISTYPNNPYRIINSKFDKLRRQNKDIYAWLTMADIIDEPVVQRDNEYYLRRDYSGRHNSNGALFLDENCSIIKRPRIYTVYGHNMKSGAMFGSLRNWQNITFYHANPFITFDTVYEDGEFVIFSVGEMSIDDVISALIIYNISGDQAQEKALSEFIRMSKWRSKFTDTIEVNSDDQILLLVTCTSQDEKRRVVVARRIRENETKEELMKCIRRARKQ